MNIVIFGISGDISNKKVIPGLYELFTELENNNNNINNIIGYGRTKFTEKSYIDMIKYNKNIDNPSDEFLNLFSYISGQYNELEGYKKIYDKLSDGYNKKILFYFGIPSQLTPNCMNLINDCGFNDNFECKYMIEKPVGNNLTKSNQIFESIYNTIQENQLFIVDHYLAKTSIYNNSFDGNIKSLNIYLNEKEDVNHRISYFDEVGIFKDMVQSHVMVIFLFLIPDIFNKYEKIKINNVKMGQYIDYSGQKKVNTFIRLNLNYNGIDITIETGKKLKKNRKEIIYVTQDNVKKYIKLKSKNYGKEYKILFQDVFLNKKEKFLTNDNIKYFWLVSDHIWDRIKDTELFYY